MVSGDDDILIRVRGLVTRFGAQTVHDGLDLDVRRGEILGVVGPSGCGKSVLLREIVGLDEATDGEIEVFGKNLAALSREEREGVEMRWGVMFQQGALFSSLTLRENVEAPFREHTDLPPELVGELASLKLVMAGLETSDHFKTPGQISGGMSKRAALARALALDPELLFLDEPTAGLDPVTAGRFDALLRELADALNLTVFLVTHDLDTLAAVCDRICVLYGGKVAAIGTLAEIKQNASGWIADYFSGPRGRAALDTKGR
ncbi:MAG: ATP-binding cassette domain-containing protein [Hyphomonadaceae bacterium]|nr:ATP-binding cassette domain-containing protein [Hyphomonadaceae bacterium]